MRTSKFAAGTAVALVCLFTLALAPPAGALTQEECEALVEEGEQARSDLQKLLEAAANDPSLSEGSSNPDTASYLADLIASTAINEFGFVSASAGEPLELCLPEGTTTLTMFSDPVVLWTGLATTDAFPVTVTIPADATCGTHRLHATGNGVDKSVDFTVGGACVTAASAAAGVGGPLPRTGAEIGRVVGVALALIAVGYSMVRSRRARAAVLID